MRCKEEGNVQDDSQFWLVHLGKRWAKLGRGRLGRGAITSSVWGTLLWLSRIWPVCGSCVPGGSPQEQRQGGRLVRLEDDKDLKQSTRRLFSLMLGGCPEDGLGVI